MEKYVGIDLGTSTTSAAVVQDGRPVMIPGPHGSPVIPSCVHLLESGRMLVGDPARSELVTDPYNTIYATKRLIGRRFDDPNVQEARSRLSYRVERSGDGRVLLSSRGREFSPGCVAALILKCVKRQAENTLSQKLKRAVISVPGTFNRSQREATSRAAEKAGLELVRFVHEPTAAAVSWGYHKNAGQTIAVFDLGGGTFDVSVLRIEKGTYKLLSRKGAAWLGGEDFDNMLVDRVEKEFKRSHKISVYNDKIAHLRVKMAAEQAKIELSEKDSARVRVPAPFPDVDQNADVDSVISREDFESMASPLVERTVESFKQAVSESGVCMDELDNVLLVGGMTRVPLVRERLEQAIGRPPDCSINPEEAVAKGAAVLAGAAAGEKVHMELPKPARPEEEEDLSGDVDLVAMYTEAMMNGPFVDGGEKRPACEAVSGQGTAGSEWNPAAVEDREMQGPEPCIKILADSDAVSSEDMAPKANGGAYLKGRIAIGGNGDRIKVKIFQQGCEDMPAAELTIKAVPGPQGADKRVGIAYRVSKGASFKVKKVSKGSKPESGQTVQTEDAGAGV